MKIFRLRTLAAWVVFTGGLTLLTAPGCSSSAVSLCEDLCDCQGCSDAALEECIDTIEDEEKRAEDAGCGDPFDDFLDCASDELTCNGASPSLDGCESEAQDLAACQDGGSFLPGVVGTGYCQSLCDCVGCSDSELSECIDEVSQGAQAAAQAGCSNEFDEVLQCLDDAVDCSSGSFGLEECETSFAELQGCAGGGGCAFTNDGVCDEPDVCPTGTDTADCQGGSCAFTNDGVCDEPDLCPPGTDINDCGGDCPFTNDGFCDEPDFCDPGTDVNDCNCPFTDDGECDEPEGTGLCAEGADPNDC